MAKKSADSKIVELILEIMYYDFDENRWDPDKEWDSETLDQVAEVVRASPLFKKILRS